MTTISMTFHKKYYKILVALFLTQSSLSYSLEQWNSSGTNSISGYICNAKENTDNTVGCEAFNDLNLQKNTRNIDIGGGKYNQNTIYLQKKFQIKNYVYDPYNRSIEHNEKVLQLAKQNPFDTATSMSVLNVINSKESRMAHIQLMFDSLRTGGIAFFKVYKGNNSGKEKYGQNRFQSNRGAETYANEVIEIFGKNNTQVFARKNLIIAKKTLKNSN